MAGDAPQPVQKSAARPGSAPGAGGGFDLFADVPTPCPSCGSPMKSGATICTHCGFNKETGQAHKTRTIAAPKDKKSIKVPSVGFSADKAAMALVAVMIGLGIFGIVQPEFALVLYLVSALVGVGTWIGGIICAFKDGDKTWGIIGLIPGVNALQIIYLLFITQRPVLRFVTIAGLIGGIASVVITFMHADSLGDQPKASPPPAAAPAPTDSAPKPGV